VPPPLATEVGPTLELVVTETEAVLRRKFDAATGCHSSTRTRETEDLCHRT
jgi:hypothetical protein